MFPAAGGWPPRRKRVAPGVEVVGGGGRPGNLLPKQERALQFFRTFTAAGLIAAAAIAPAVAADISGAGSSFAYPIYAKWMEAYKQETGIGVDYRSVGSADGIRQVQNKQITFGATDMPLGARDLEADGLVQFPTVVAGGGGGGQVEGIKSGGLTLDGPAPGEIFFGGVKAWEDG